MLTTHPTASDYQRVFELACPIAYPKVDDFERRMGCAVDRARLDAVARVLACPVKKNPPHWQHGRVIYAATRRYLQDRDPSPLRLLDIGTAKGFSAWCLLRACQDVGQTPSIASVDVIDPRARVTRNTVSEVDGLLTLDETHAEFPELWLVDFFQSTGLEWLATNQDRIHVAFVDGKHEGSVVRQEGKLLAARQEPGDMAIFDDCQLPGVSVAVVSLEEWYRIEYVKAEPREYAIARRR